MQSKQLQIPKKAVINHWMPASTENPPPVNFSRLLIKRGEWANGLDRIE